MTGKRMWKVAALAAALSGLPLAAMAGDGPVRVVREGGLASEWIVRPGTVLAAPGSPAQFASRGEDVCVAVGYRVQPDGTTSDPVVLRSWNSRTRGEEPETGYWNAYSRAAAGALAEWRFAPRDGVDREAVDTVAIMTFRGHGASTPDLAKRCTVPNLVAAMQYARRSQDGRDDVAIQSWARPWTGRAARDGREAREAASRSAAAYR